MANPDGCTSDVYPELFHYTTIEAFQNIVHSSQFWATHFEDLNDSTEFLRFSSKIHDFILPIIKRHLQSLAKKNVEYINRILAAGGIDSACDYAARGFSNSMFQEIFGKGGLNDTFVCSFCFHLEKSYAAENGLLSQWRGYGAGGGVAIVLDTGRMEGLLKKEAATFHHPVLHIGNVSYDNDPEFLERKAVRALFERLPSLLEDLYSDRPPAYDEVFTSIVLGTTLLKHHAFSEENEVRIVVSPAPSDENSIFREAKQVPKTARYRRKGDGEVRYIELFGTEPLPIKRIIVGPSRIQNVCYEKVRKILTGTGIQVIKSQTPFLG